MTNDLIDYRRGKITLDELRRLFPKWQVSPEYAKACVAIAQASPLKAGARA